MSDQSPATNEATVASTESTQETTQAKSYTQEEFDNHMAGLKASISKKYERQLGELGDINEHQKRRKLKTLLNEASSKKPYKI